MLKKDRIAIEKIIAKNYDIFIEDEYGVATAIGREIADYIAIDNPHFNKQKFLKACGVSDN